MPLYEYYCQLCQKRFELLRPISQSEEPTTCPSGHHGATRAISTFVSFSKGADGSLEAMNAGSGCAACAGGHCATCGVR